MLPDEELVQLLNDLESARSERKESARDSRDIHKAICALANDLPNHRLPGVIFVGAKNDGSCAGIEIDDELLLRLSNMRSDGTILPLPHIEVEAKMIQGCRSAVVIVHPSKDVPLRYEGRIYVRVGPSTRLASANEEARLIEKRRSQDTSFDSRPVRGATVNDLDLRFFTESYLPNAIAPDILEQNNRSTEQQLASLRFLSPSGEPSVAAILAFGRDPLGYLPGAYIQFIRFDGPDLSSGIKDEKPISGPLHQVLSTADDLTRLNISTEVNITGGMTEVRRPDYPLAAIQQILRNAVLHRSYEGTNAPVRFYWFSDRIEIQNPGGPFGLVTPENFGQPQVTDYRNPLLAETMKVLGFVQRFGVGIQIARTELKRNGNPDLEHTALATHVQVVIRSRA